MCFQPAKATGVQTVGCFRRVQRTAWQWEHFGNSYAQVTVGTIVTGMPRFIVHVQCREAQKPSSCCCGLRLKKKKRPHARPAKHETEAQLCGSFSVILFLYRNNLLREKSEQEPRNAVPTPTPTSHLSVLLSYYRCPPPTETCPQFTSLPKESPLWVRHPKYPRNKSSDWQAGIPP